MHKEVFGGMLGCMIIQCLYYCLYIRPAHAVYDEEEQLSWTIPTQRRKPEIRKGD